MKSIHITATYTEFSSLDELNHEMRDLIRTAIDALDSSYSPYSLFRVGSAVLLGDDSVVVGSNQENAAFPSGLCAERVALFAAGAQYPGKEIRAMAIVADTRRFNLPQPVTPCGACRQVISEYEQMQTQPVKILLHNLNGTTWMFEGIAGLLPLGFQENKLKKQS